MDHFFETQCELPLAVDRIFDFFAAAENLQRITPPELHFRILTPGPIRISTGTRIEYALRLFGVPFQWSTLISIWDPPRRFVDEQLRGPYAVWEHTHTFEPTASGTAMLDRVRYRLPLSPLGELAHPLVRWQINRIFAYRERAVFRELAPLRNAQP